jgi:hypothetical protein
MSAAPHAMPVAANAKKIALPATSASPMPEKVQRSLKPRKLKAAYLQPSVHSSVNFLEKKHLLKRAQAAIPEADALKATVADKIAAAARTTAGKAVAKVATVVDKAVVKAAKNATPPLPAATSHNLLFA